jgi:uncharacterized protein YabE (DUF348 family)
MVCNWCIEANGPKKDLKINADGSTKKDIWTTPDKFKTKKEAIDKLEQSPIIFCLHL